MDDLVKTEGTGLVSLLHGAGGELSVPLPFEREIFLFDTYVAGTTHIAGIEELAPHLHEGDKLRFYREPDNPYDKQAIVIKNEDGVKIGYVPQKDNVIFAAPDGCWQAAVWPHHGEGAARGLAQNQYQDILAGVNACRYSSPPVCRKTCKLTVFSQKGESTLSI